MRTSSSASNSADISGKNNLRVSGLPQFISADQSSSASANYALLKPASSVDVNFRVSAESRVPSSSQTSAASVVAVSAQNVAAPRSILSAPGLRPPVSSSSHHDETSALATLASALDPVPSPRQGKFSQIDIRDTVWDPVGSYLPNDFHRNDYHTSDTFPGPTKLNQSRRKSDRRSKEEKKEAFRKAFPPGVVEGPTAFPMLSLYRVFGKFSMDEIRELSEEAIRQQYQNWRDVEAHNRKALRAQKKFNGRSTKQ